MRIRWFWRKRRGPKAPEHLGATANWSPLRAVAAVPAAPELEQSPEVRLLHQVQAELDPVNHALARFGRRMSELVEEIAGPLEETRAIGQLELARIFAEGRQLEPLQ